MNSSRRQERWSSGIESNRRLIATRVAMGVDVLARLHQQIQQVLVGMRDARQAKGKAEKWRP
ncbi:MAG: hypothetical protein ABL970_00290 [Nitrospira sp.]